MLRLSGLSSIHEELRMLLRLLFRYGLDRLVHQMLTVPITISTEKEACCGILTRVHPHLLGLTLSFKVGVVNTVTIRLFSNGCLHVLPQRIIVTSRLGLGSSHLSLKVKHC